MYRFFHTTTVLFQFLFLLMLMVIAWFSLRFLFPKNPKLRVMGLFGCTHKSMAVGVPLITALYGNSPSLPLYLLPLIIWHPMNLVVGTILTPRLAAFVAREQDRLGLDTNDKPICLVSSVSSSSSDGPSPPAEEAAVEKALLPANDDDDSKLNASEEGRAP